MSSRGLWQLSVAAGSEELKSVSYEGWRTAANAWGSRRRRIWSERAYPGFHQI